MSALPGRHAVALVVVDVQNGVVEQAFERDRVVGTIADLVAGARAADVPVVWVQHADDELVRGSPAWEWVPELRPRASEPAVHKQFGDAFEATDLEQVLAAAEVGSLVVAGAQTDACVRSTIHGAFTRGYDVTLVGDAHTTEDFTDWGAPPPADVIAHTNLYWHHQEAPGRTAAVVAAGDVVWSDPCRRISAS
ncbi:isochorismatase family protein [Aeromicrobium marinum DSM 15272]|uniref:Isochorismatase family protein n=1 Tax=Aeromicrobium marinum DSM 15272 TaxID=585531 RepID=E2S9T4_9ACTN|nr:isochorismatase family protein [Aeromicrobium marinum]EFQ84008.1 isochorismatase family protein [Aeromicrobium marinum DSM 15272]